MINKRGFEHHRRAACIARPVVTSAVRRAPGQLSDMLLELRIYSRSGAVYLSVADTTEDIAFMVESMRLGY
jgi:hypothetical protein